MNNFFSEEAMRIIRDRLRRERAVLMSFRGDFPIEDFIEACAVTFNIPASYVRQILIFSLSCSHQELLNLASAMPQYMNLIQAIAERRLVARRGDTRIPTEIVSALIGLYRSIGRTSVDGPLADRLRVSRLTRFASGGSNWIVGIDARSNHDFLPGRSYTAADVRAVRSRILATISDINSTLSIMVLSNFHTRTAEQVLQGYVDRNFPTRSHSSASLREMQSIEFRNEGLAAS
jgi:hypothetical protein